MLQGQLVEAAPQLTSLTLIKCPWLTNSAVKHLQQLRGLAAISLADNGNIRSGAVRLTHLTLLVGNPHIVDQFDLHIKSQRASVHQEHGHMMSF